MANTNKLSPKQERFCQEYLIDLNASAAYTRAGYKASSPEVAWVNASKLLRNHKVQAYIQELRSAREERTEISGDRVLKEIARIAFANITDVLSFNDQAGVVFKNSSELSDDTKAAIAEVSSDVETRTYRRGEDADEVETTVKRKLKMHNKMDALKHLSAYLGLTSDFNVATQALMKYGLKLQQSDRTESGWEVVNIENAPTSSTTQG